MSDLKSTLKESYKEYNKDVVDYMDRLVDLLIEKYGEINPAWTVSLEMIAFNYDIIRKCQKDINQYGLEKEDSRGRNHKNPSLMVLNQAQNYLIKFLNAFGLNLAAASKLKNIDTDEDVFDDLLS